MSRNILETIMGGIVLLVAVWFFVSAYQGRGSSSGEGYELRAHFNDVTGVGIGSDVRIGGVKIGTVESITLNPETYQAELAMLVGDEIKLPADSDAAIVGESLLGGKFVALTPGGDDAMLQAGDVIEFTQSSVSLEQLLGKFVFSGGGVDDGTSDDDDFELSVP